MTWSESECLSDWWLNPHSIEDATGFVLIFFAACWQFKSLNFSFSELIAKPGQKLYSKHTNSEIFNIFQLNIGPVLKFSSYQTWKYFRQASLSLSLTIRQGIMLTSSPTISTASLLSTPLTCGWWGSCSAYSTLFCFQAREDHVLTISQL